MHIPASPGSFQLLDFTAKPCRTTLGTMRIKVFMAFVFMGWRENQMILKLWLVSSLAFYCSHKPGLAAWVCRHNPPETSQLQFLATNYYPLAAQLQVPVLSSRPHSPSHKRLPRTQSCSGYLTLCQHTGKGAAGYTYNTASNRAWPRKVYKMVLATTW